MKYSNKFRIPFSQTGVTDGISVIGAAQIVEDSVCAFFASFGKDNFTVSKRYGAMWVFVRNKFRRYAFAGWNEEISVMSYVTEKTAAKVIVDTQAKNAKGETVLSARTELCVIDIAAQRIRRVASVDFPENIGIYPSVAGFDFTRPETPALKENYRFIVPSTSIDLCGHLNNAEYFRFILNATGAEKEIARPVSDAEINFVSQAREGEELTVYCGESAAGEFYELKSGEKTVARCVLSREAINLMEKI